ncbi:MAG: precorrin-6y C5,15-methyltransferase (decarboxylating) subunit CbiE [Enterocloster sp.]
MDNQERVIYLIGIGMGGEDQLTGRALECLERSQAVMGADRMLESVQDLTGERQVLSAYRPSDMVQWLLSFQWKEAALVLSGDTGFYSGAEAASKAFQREGWKVELIPGISSLSYFCARLGRNWQDVHPLSIHGRDCDVAANIRKYRTCFILLGGEGSVPELCRRLVSSGMGNVILRVGENLSYEDERISDEMTPAELLMENENCPFGSLCCVLAENPQAEEEKLYPQPAPSDSEFIRGRVPMTKETVRRVSIEKLRIGADAVCYDIGAGTGSVAVEMAREIRNRCGRGQVYAIEKNEEALELIEANFKKFHGSWSGFHLIFGEAPEALEGLEPPTHVFIGGSCGRLAEIIGWLLQVNPQVRIVANAITLETVSELLACMRDFGFEEGELLQLWAAPVEKMGSYHMPKAQNPIYVAVMQHPAEEEEDLEWQDL